MQNPTADSRPVESGRSFLRVWIATTAAGWATGFLPVMFVITGALKSDTDVIRNPVATGLYYACMYLLLLSIGPAMIGIGQGFALTDHANARWGDKWFRRTFAGTTIGWILGWIGGLLTYTINLPDALVAWLLRSLVVGTVVGLAAGIAQGDLLGANGFNGGRWALVSTLSWAAASIVYWLVYHLTGGPFQATTIYYDDGFWPKGYEAPGAWLAMPVGWLVGGLVLGSISGLAMKRLVVNEASLTVE
jgi:hypothetical protein